MGKARIIALTTAIVVLGGGAAAIVEVQEGGGNGGGRTDAARLQSDIAAKLPAGWTDTVDRSGDTVNVRLVHEGGMNEMIDAMHADKIVNPDEAAMMRLLPADLTHTSYVFHYSDTKDKDKGTLLRVAAGKGHPGPHPVLLFMSRDLVAAELAQAPKPVPTVVGGPVR